MKHPKILEQFNAFMIESREEILTLKQKYGIEHS